VGNFARHQHLGPVQSEDDQSGQNGNINNSSLGFLPAIRRITGLPPGLQYYIEHMLDFDQHKKAILWADRDKDRNW
jgi:hypothetical protein